MVGKLLHPHCCGYWLQSEAIYLHSFCGDFLVEVNVALVVGPLIVATMNILKVVEFHGIHPLGALFVSLLAIGTCCQSMASKK